MENRTTAWSSTPETALDAKQPAAPAGDSSGKPTGRPGYPSPISARNSTSASNSSHASSISVIRDMDLSHLSLANQVTMSSEQPSEFTYELDPDESVTDGVIEAVAAAANQEPTSLDPLYSILDPDALDTLFKPEYSANPQVTFQYNGCLVQVISDEKIEIRTTDNEG